MVERETLISLVQAVQQGADGAAGELYQTFYQDIYYYIFKTVNDRELAEDLTQDTFMEILDTIDRLKEPAAFVTWSRQIAFHRCTAHFRKRRELLADEDEDGYSVFDTVEEDRTEFIPDAALDQEDLKRTIHAMIDSLPEEQRSALMMRYFDELSVAQIAQIQGVSEGTVKSRLNYGRKAVKKSVEDYEKKNGIKLRCVGILPVLLWALGRKKLVEAATNVVTGVVAQTAADVAVEAAADVATEAASDTAAEAAASGLGKLAAKLGKSLAKSLGMKIAAGVAAAAVVGGGAAVVANLPEEPAKEKKPKVWVGYDNLAKSSSRRHELTVERRTQDTISGNLTVSHMYETVYDSDFEGEATESEEGRITYVLTFEDDYVVGFMDTHHNDLEVVYDQKSDTFLLDDYFDAKLYRVKSDPEVLEKRGSWSGLGKDSLYIKSKGHLFQVEAEQITEATIKGRLRVSYEDQVDQDTGFTGRGYYHNGKYYYELMLDTPRPYEITGPDGQVDRLWLVFDENADTMKVSGTFYSADLTREK